MATTIDAARVAELISLSPGWARVALVGRDRELRDAAARAMAALIAERHDEPGPCRDAAQLPLPLA